MAADLTISVDIDARKTKAGASEAKSAIKGVGDETEKAGRKVKSVADRDFKELEKAMRSAAAQGTLIGNAIGQAFDALLRGAVGLTKAIIGLATSYAEFGKEIDRAQQITGLSARTLSALKSAAETSGRSFDEVGEALKNFTKTIGDANNGSKEASAKLGRLGIDGKKAANDLDGAFREALKRIVSLPAGVQQANAAMDAFGENGFKLLPLIKSFDGDLDKLIATAERLGVILSEDDVRAAAEFDKSLKEVQERVRGVMYTFGKELLPVVKTTLDNIGIYLENNKAKVKSWAESFSEAVSNVALTTQGIGLEMESGTGFFGILDRGLGKLDYFLRNILPATAIYSKYTEKLRQDARFANAQQFVRPDNTIDFGKLQGQGTTAPTPPPENPYFNPPPPKAPKVPRAQRPQMSEEQKQAERLRDLLKDLQLEIDFFGQKSEEAGVRQQLMKMGITGSNQALADQAIALAKDLDAIERNAEATKKAAEAAKKLQEDFAKERSGLVNDSFNTNVGLGAELNKLKEQIALGRELTAVEEQRIDNAAQRLTYERELQIYGYTQDQIAILLSILDAEQGRTIEILKQVQAKRDLQSAELAYKNLIEGLGAELQDITLQYQELTSGVETSRVAILQLSEAYKRLTPEQQKAATERAAEIDGIRESIKAHEEAIRAYDDMFDTIRDSLGVLAEEGFGAFFKNIARKFQDFLLDMVAQWLTSKFFQMFFKGGNQQAAQSSGSGSGGIFGAIQNAIFGGGGQGQGPGGTPNWNPNASGVGGGSASLPTITLPNGEQAVQVNGGGGGLFGGGRLAGGLALAGAGANILGGAIGGRVGGFISNIGTGVALGAQIGSIIPGIGTAIGAVIGGAVGFFASLFGGDPKRKRDKKEKIPQLNQGFTDSLAELRGLVADVRTLRVSPDSAISRAVELRNSIASGFGIQFESKKYKKEAQRLIATRLAEADSLIEDLRKAAEVARAAGERERRIIPSFASGVYMSGAFTRQFAEFQRRNGLTPGRFAGIDSMPSMLAPGEMVLNPSQQSRVRANAGTDPFVNAGIPGYSGGSRQEAPAAAGDMSVQIFVSQDASGMWTATAKSPDGRKVIAEVVKEKFRNNEIDTKRRGV